MVSHNSDYRSLHPFPTLWAAREGTSGLLALLPQSDELFVYLEAFRHRAQGCGFPRVPEECTKDRVDAFLSDVRGQTHAPPDRLALLFAALAQGVRQGIYDRCGSQWIASMVTSEATKGEAFSTYFDSIPRCILLTFKVAAAMQALRLAAYLSRPNIQIVETLLIIGSYLTNSGKFLESCALFGTTVRLAQAIGCEWILSTHGKDANHSTLVQRDPTNMRPCPDASEVRTRRSLWWWILYVDQQYSITLTRPLGILSIGDCVAPGPTFEEPLQSLSNYYSTFTTLSRQILSTTSLENLQIDRFTNQLHTLRRTLPSKMRFDANWLDTETRIPPWPLDAQAAFLHQVTHNLLILLNRQREEAIMDNVNGLTRSASTLVDPSSGTGRQRVLSSCREILQVFEFFRSRVRAGMVLWTNCQHAFNAASLLIMGMRESGNMSDQYLVCQAHNTFLEIHELGIHRLAGMAANKLENLMREVPSISPSMETVMRYSGQPLVEDFDESFSNLFNPSDSSERQRTSKRPESQEANSTKTDSFRSKSSKKAKLGNPKSLNVKVKASAKKTQRKDSSSQGKVSGAWATSEWRPERMDSTSVGTNAGQGFAGVLGSPSAAQDISTRIVTSSPTPTPRSVAEANRPHGRDAAHCSKGSIGLDGYPIQRVTGDCKSWSVDTDATTPTAACVSSVYNDDYSQMLFQSQSATAPSNSQPPSLYVQSYPSSTYAQSNPSTLHTPVASHPVSPSASQSQGGQGYCINQSRTQTDSPGWGFDQGVGIFVGDSMHHGMGQAVEVGENFPGNERKYYWQGGNFSDFH